MSAAQEAWDRALMAVASGRLEELDTLYEPMSRDELLRLSDAARIVRETAEMASRGRP